MVEIRYRGKKGIKVGLVERADFVVVRTKGNRRLAHVGLGAGAQRAVTALRRVASFAEAGVEILHGPRTTVSEARAQLKAESEIRFAGRVLCDSRSKDPVAYTENLFVKCHDDAKSAACLKLLKGAGLTVKRQLDYARNAFFVEAKEGIGQDVFPLALELLDKAEVELAHPEVVRRVSYRAAFAQQWHLHKTTIGGKVIDAHGNVVAAWDKSEGDGITIAVIDDGVDLDHEEFVGGGKIVSPRDVTRRTDNPRPASGDHHGTACAGVACAAGRVGASGVAPKARLMPIRLASGLGSQAEADAFVWAAQHGADVISCSWGPVDGEWFTPGDPLHRQVVALPDSTRLAIDFAIANGRAGKGCVILWAAGNGNESVDNDGYASYEKVTAVAACNDGGTRSAYSDMGKALWCAFPSNNGFASKTPGIWTTDRSGTNGYNPGSASEGDAAGNYTNSFGGTSSACPGAAGVAALVLARNPALRWDQVKDVLKRCSDKIDQANGGYDQDGRSALYGYGRLNAAKAVALAEPAQPRRSIEHRIRQDLAIEDLKTSRLSLDLADGGTPQGVRVSVEIEHSFIGDLVVRLKPPQGAAIVLHDRAGGGTRDLKTTFDALTTPALAGLAGRSPQGTWTLEVADKAKRDVGTLRGFAIELAF